MAAEALGEEGLQPHRLYALLHQRVAEGIDILRGGALCGILDDALLEDQRVGGVDDDQPRVANVRFEAPGQIFQVGIEFGDGARWVALVAILSVPGYVMLQK